MTIEEIKKYLAENAADEGVKGFLTELSKPSAEAEAGIIEAFKKSKDFLSEVDSRISKAVNTHDQNIRPKMEAELKRKIELELNPPKDPAMVAIQEELAAIKKAAAEKDAILEKQKRDTFLYQNIKPEYKDILKVVDGTITDDNEKVQFLNKTLFELQTKVTGKPVQSAPSATAITNREALKTMKPEEISKAMAEGKLDAMLGRVN